MPPVEVVRKPDGSVDAEKTLVTPGPPIKDAPKLKFPQHTGNKVIRTPDGAIDGEKTVIDDTTSEYLKLIAVSAVIGISLGVLLYYAAPYLVFTLIL